MLFLRLFLIRWLRFFVVVFRDIYWFGVDNHCYLSKKIWAGSDFLSLFFVIFTDLVLIIIVIYRKKYELLINFNLYVNWYVNWYKTYLTTSKCLHSIQSSNNHQTKKCILATTNWKIRVMIPHENNTFV